jgi:hypothetical protein
MGGLERCGSRLIQTRKFSAKQTAWPETEQNIFIAGGQRLAYYNNSLRIAKKINNLAHGV